MFGKLEEWKGDLWRWSRVVWGHEVGEDSRGCVVRASGSHQRF